MTTNTSTFTQFLKTYQQRSNDRLQQYLPPATQEPQQLHKAMRYAVLGKGKRIRPLLVYATGLCFNTIPEKLDIPAAAVELIHAYSLIHDDLPAMDDDDIRREQPSCHKVFNEATAILAGDTLQSLAFELLTKENSTYSARQQLKMVQVLAHACGSQGMTGGQQLDLEATEKKLSTPDIEKIHSLKTTALIKASVTLGATAMNCEQSQINTLNHFASMIGLAFQLQDDIFDIDNNIDIDCTKKQLQVLFEKAFATLDNLPSDMSYLKELSYFIMRRTF